MRSQAIAVLLATLLCVGCVTGQVHYTPPFDFGPVPTSATVHMPKDEVWAKLIPAIGRTYFDIHVIDKESGIINLAYSGVPERAVDCGMFTAEVKSLTWNQQYTYPGAQAKVAYEVAQSNALYYLSRSLSLDGQINVVVTETALGSTEVTAKVRYALTRTVSTQSSYYPWPEVGADQISFESNGVATFSPLEPYPLTCRSRGEIERNLLSIVQP